MTSTADALAASLMVAVGSPSQTLGSSPSPIWASVLSVPMTDFASLAKAYWSSFVRRAPPMNPICAGSYVRRRVAAVSSASDHDTVAGAEPLAERICGCVRRPGAEMDSKLKRPLSHSQPQLTASESTPWVRVMTSPLDCSTTRQPDEQPMQVDSTWSRSHGRAVKR